MSGSDNTPMLDFGAPRHEGVCAVLICAGQAVATAMMEGVRVSPGAAVFGVTAAG